jgi:hypothetical protein
VPLFDACQYKECWFKRKQSEFSANTYQLNFFLGFKSKEPPPLVLYQLQESHTKEKNQYDKEENGNEKERPK